jgi:hypothetical protein
MTACLPSCPAVPASDSGPKLERELDQQRHAVSRTRIAAVAVIVCEDSDTRRRGRGYTRRGAGPGKCSNSGTDPRGGHRAENQRRPGADLRRCSEKRANAASRQPAHADWHRPRTGRGAPHSLRYPQDESPISRQRGEARDTLTEPRQIAMIQSPVSQGWKTIRPLRRGLGVVLIASNKTFSVISYELHLGFKDVAAWVV